jgi:hypothetical protein
MYDPFIDPFNEEQPLQAPFAPSRPVPPTVNPAASNVQINPAVSPDAAALLDPFGSIPTTSRITRAPAMASATGATPNVAYDPIGQPKGQTGILTISTQENPPPALSKPLENIFGTHDKDDAGPSMESSIKPTLQFPTMQLFQPPPTRRHPLVPPPSSFLHPNPHARGTSDGFVSFVSVPSLDPLSPADPAFTGNTIVGVNGEIYKADVVRIQHLYRFNGDASMMIIQNERSRGRQRFS